MSTMTTGDPKKNNGFLSWAPNIDQWPQSWMREEDDLEYGRQLLPTFTAFLQDLYDQGLARKTFVRYRDDLWLLGGTIVSRKEWDKDEPKDPLDRILAAVECDGILPDHYAQMSGAELRGFERMCRKFEKYLRGKTEDL